MGEDDGFCGFVGQSGTCRLQGLLGGGGGEALCHRSLTCCLPSRVVMVECGAQDGPQGLGHRDLGCPAGLFLFLQSVQVITFLFSKKRQKGDGV